MNAVLEMRFLANLAQILLQYSSEQSGASPQVLRLQTLSAVAGVKDITDDAVSSWGNPYQLYHSSLQSILVRLTAPLISHISDAH